MRDRDRTAETAHRRGEIIDDQYVLGDVLGVGGMGVVYAAIQMSLRRTIAIKLPRPELLHDERVRAQFHTEAMTGARIRHRNVVGVVDFGVHAGAPYLALEHVVGPRLGEVLTDRGALPLALAANLVHQVLSGLAHVHAEGIVHGDVKCDNVLVEGLRDGSSVPRLMDFGLARFANEAWTDTDDIVTGTPEYVAPELVHGGPTTFASDVYAAGVMCYELVTGETPFTGGNSEETLKRHVDELPIPLSSRRPRVPPALDTFVAHALAKEPRDRFASAREMRDALADVALEIAKRPVTTEEAHPLLCSSEETTAPLQIPATVRALGSNDRPTRVEERRRALEHALLQRDPNVVVIAYLDLTRALVDIHDLHAAISELEHGVANLLRDARPGPVWRLQLTLAALYDGIGDRARACTTMREAQEEARRQGSSAGQRRAKALFVRLVRHRAP